VGTAVVQRTHQADPTFYWVTEDARVLINSINTVEVMVTLYIFTEKAPNEGPLE